MNRIDSIFATHRPLLIPFITGGCPSLSVTRHVLPALEGAGASIIEIGFPFTDPIADGPVIAGSMHAALLRGATPRSIFNVVRDARPTLEAGIIAMVTDSIITRIGPETFVREAAASGFDGLIVPDIDLDAAAPVAGLARVHGLSFTMLIAPTSTSQRIARIVNLSSGFVYVLARVGITGVSGELDEHLLEQRLAIVRTHTDLPLAVGFGISRGEQVRSIGTLADGVVVGSALVQRMREAEEGLAVTAAASFVAELAANLPGPRSGIRS